MDSYEDFVTLSGAFTVIIIFKKVLKTNKPINSSYFQKVLLAKMSSLINDN